MMDRGIIKWKPFNSCISTENMLKECDIKNARLKMPTLSDDQIFRIEKIIVEAFYLQTNVIIKYYYNGKIEWNEGIIKNINTNEKKIYLNNKVIFLKQILDIDFN